MAAPPAAAAATGADGATMMDEMARRKRDEIPERDGGVFIGRYETLWCIGGKLVPLDNCGRRN